MIKEAIETTIGGNSYMVGQTCLIWMKTKLSLFPARQSKSVDKRGCGILFGEVNKYWICRLWFKRKVLWWSCNSHVYNFTCYSLTKLQKPFKYIVTCVIMQVPIHQPMLFCSTFIFLLCRKMVLDCTLPPPATGTTPQMVNFLLLDHFPTKT